MIDAKEYIQKINKICQESENGKCNEKQCILFKFGCGIPRKDADIDTVVDLIENYEDKKYPFGRCGKCGYEFNSELVNEYNIKHCLDCGEKLEAPSFREVR
jgi:hypothetical protein